MLRFQSQWTILWHRNWYRTKRCRRLRYARCDDCVCIEKASHACTLPKKLVSKSSVLRKTTDSYEGGSFRTWSTSMFEPLEIMKLQDSSRYSIFAYRMMTFRISIQDWTRFYYLSVKYKRKMFGRICTTWRHETLFSFRLYWLCLNKRFFESMNNRAIQDWRHQYDVKLIRQWGREKPAWRGK